MKVQSVEIDKNSLTQHQDAAAQAIELLRATFAERIKRPGGAGTRARIQFAMLEAWSVALAYERDLGSEPHEIIFGARDALGDVGASSIISTIHDAPTAVWIETIGMLFGQAHNRAVDAAIRMRENPGSDEFTGVGYKVRPTQRAD